MYWLRDDVRLGPGLTVAGLELLSPLPTHPTVDDRENAAEAVGQLL
jgi:hypothetical protein